MPPRAPTPDEFAQWLTPSQAAKMLMPAFGIDRHEIARDALLKRLKGGLIRAVARQTVRHHGRSELSDIPLDDWERVATYDAVWVTNDITFEYMESGPYARERRTVQHFEVRFEPQGVKDMIVSTPLADETPITSTSLFAGGVSSVDHDYNEPAPTNPPVSPTNRGGRPSKEWWADLWVEMCRQIYAGDLKHEKQVDIEKAMADWLSDQGHEAGEQTIRRAARKLFAALSKEDQN